MKTKIYLALVSFVILSSINLIKAQTIILNMSDKTYNVSADYIKTGEYYIKDINNYLDSFTGTWEYVNGSEKFQITLHKTIQYHVSVESLGWDFYEDGIYMSYKKYQNNNLVFESPIDNFPSFQTEDGVVLDGSAIDYGRVTVSVYDPELIGGALRLQGGMYFNPSCIIKKLDNLIGEPQKIKFSLSFGESIGQYNNPLYVGQPTFSIPNNIIMTKVQ